jgi:predicted amidohydrolase
MVDFRVAAIQMRSGVDTARNAADFEALVREAAEQGARYVQSPEMTGALQRDRKSLFMSLRPQSTDLIAGAAEKLSRELGIYVHVGSTAIAREDRKIANRAFLFDPAGNLVTTYDKIHMFDVDLDNGESWRESATYEPGRDTMVVELPEARLGLAVCYDLRFPQLFRAQAIAGGEIITTPAA